MSELTQLEVVELSALISEGSVSPVEVATDFLDRIDAHNSKLNAFVTVDRESALSAGAEAARPHEPCGRCESYEQQYVKQASKL